MKKILSLRFSKAVDTYNKWALPQKKSAIVLSSLLTEINGRVLDVGCGTGFVAEHIGCHDITGVDISLPMSVYFKERFGKAVVGDCEYLPFKDNSFDWAVSNFVLHWTDVGKSIGEMIRVSRKGVGIALPVGGSVDIFGFPFPEEDRVFDIIISYGCKIDRWFIKEIDVPYRGWDILRFFHYTGTSYNPRGNITFSKRKLEERIKDMTSLYFRVLFFLCKIKS